MKTKQSANIMSKTKQPTFINEQRAKAAAIKRINEMITQYINFMRKQGYAYDSPEDKAVLELLNHQWIEYCNQKKLASEAYMLLSMNVIRMLETAKAKMQDQIGSAVSTGGLIQRAVMDISISEAREENESSEDYMERMQKAGFTLQSTAE